MNWKDYQDLQAGQGRNRLFTPLFLALGVIAIAVAAFFASSAKKPGATAQNETLRIAPVAKSQKMSLKGLLTSESLDSPSGEIQIVKDGTTKTIELAIDPDLQSYVTKELRRYRVDWAGAVLMDPATGRVLAMVEHSEKPWEGGHLAMSSTFPAASVFKVITASAALSEGVYQRNSSIRFSGGMYGIGPRQVLKSSGNNEMTLAAAFAKSANVVFGKIGSQGIGGNALAEYAKRYGFNLQIPFELDAQASHFDATPGEPLDEARLAAGFGPVTLSPLHGAMIAASVLNEGRMMEPYVVQRILGDEGRIEYEAQPAIWQKPLDPVTALEMRKMMMRTITEGTAHRAFRRVERDRALANLDIGGKTGSLTGKMPAGKNEWFVGYARGAGRQIAIGVVIVSESIWRLKPAELARGVFHRYFSPKSILEASLKQNADTPRHD